MSRLFIVIPALNEGPNLPRLLRDLGQTAAELGGQFDVRLVLVDDGSTDGTADDARRLAAGIIPIDVVRHDEPMGPGQAFHDGFSALSGHVAADDVVMTLEADNTSRLELVQSMLDGIDAGADVVFASPYMPGGGVIHTSLWRRLLSKVANTVVKRALGLHGICTVSSFYRMYSGESFTRMQALFGPGIVDRTGFECMVEFAMKLRAAEMDIVEVPMVLDTSQRIGASRMRVMRTTLGYLALIRGRRQWRQTAVGTPTMAPLAPAEPAAITERVPTLTADDLTTTR